VRLTSLAPVVAPDCRVLILGSMPGELSLERGEYYAHPRNRFWPVMGELFGARPELDYATRLARLHAAGVGLWDVLRHCVRSGSLDTSIVRGSEVPNDFESLLGAVPSLRTVALNGAKAAQTFRRSVVPVLTAEQAQRLTLLDMPSTSPANASRSLRDLVQAWSRILP
jgi:double-stranded uracil-DNA glycosylase